MSRPRKSTVDYFPHDTTHGKTIYVLQTRWGNDGYAVWFKILERLGASDNHCIDCNDRATVIHLAAYCLVEETKLREILGFLAEVSAIHLDLWQQNIIYSENFVKNIADAYRKRINSYPTIEKVSHAHNVVLDRFLPAETTSSVVIDGRNPQRERERERERERKDLSPPITESVETDRMTCGELRKRYEDVTKRRINSGSEITVLQKLAEDFTATALEEGLETTATAAPDKPLPYFVAVMRKRDPPQPKVDTSMFEAALEEERRQRAAGNVR